MAMQFQGRVKEVALWKRKAESLAFVGGATALWVLLQIYGINFITLASWFAMFTVTCLFLYGNILRLLHKSDAEVGAARWEIRRETVEEAAESGKRAAEEVIRWMFRVSVESEWYIFARTVTGLLLVGYVARFCDFFSLLYAGAMVGMTVPVIYSKYEERMSDYGRRCRVWYSRLYTAFDEKVVRKVGQRVSVITRGNGRDGVGRPPLPKKTE